MTRTIVLLLFVAASECLTHRNDTIWPIPAEVYVLSGPALPIDRHFLATSNSSSVVVADAVERYTKLISGTAGPIEENTQEDLALVTGVEVQVVRDDETLDWNTDYSYELLVNGANSVVIVAASPFGAVYGLETFSQLVVNGTLLYTNVSIRDYPKFQHRGLLIDSGRRIYPKSLVLQLLDALNYVKMNVLHLHISDHCRFSVESRMFPSLMEPWHDNYYSRDDIMEIVEYARLRGIRVVPEIDTPGHTHGLYPLSHQQGVVFCSDDLEQLYNDPAGQTLRTVKSLYYEMASLFPEKLFHIGADETAVKGNCTLENIGGFEREIIEFLVSLGKVPIGWEEVLFDTKAANSQTVVNDWTRYRAIDSVRKGYLTIESQGQHFYLNHANYGGAWLDIAPNFTDFELKLLLGGEMSMWTDNYCGCSDCPQNAPAKWMFERKYDAVFAQSVGGMIWPRGIAAAGSFWNFVPEISDTSPEFLHRYEAQNKRMTERGIFTCPVDCFCDELTVCGVPYSPD